MSNTKKVILFLTEGITDKVSLEGILTNLLAKEKVRFHVIDGDLTAREDVNAQNVVNAVTQCIKDFIAQKSFKRSDILLVVHLADTDGAFVPAEAVKYFDTERPLYFDDCIETKNPNAIRRRNSTKTAALDRLTEQKTIYSISYKIYFFSRCLEHVLHNVQAKLTKKEKMKLAEDFSDKYAERPDLFIDFISSKDFAVNGDYRQTWDFIRKDLNSLKRFCNFHLFFEGRKQ